MMAHPASSLEQRARELDLSVLRRAKTAGLHELRHMRASHERLFHSGMCLADSCWVCKMLERALYRKLRGA